MRAVTRTGPGQVELNYIWLPTFIGMNAALKKEMEDRLAPKIEGRPLDDTTLDDAHQEVIDFLVEKFPGVGGLRDYLDAIKYVQDG